MLITLKLKIIKIELESLVGENSSPIRTGVADRKVERGRGSFSGALRPINAKTAHHGPNNSELSILINFVYFPQSSELSTALFFNKFHAFSLILIESFYRHSSRLLFLFWITNGQIGQSAPVFLFERFPLLIGLCVCVCHSKSVYLLINHKQSIYSLIVRSLVAFLEKIFSQLKDYFFEQQAPTVKSSFEVSSLTLYVHLILYHGH